MRKDVARRAGSGFNSRTREGATGKRPEALPFLLVSIHAPVRVRPAPQHLTSLPGGFNSRTREGATIAVLLHDQLPEVSIHAPVRVRRDLGFSDRDIMEFQFTHP